jgi:hypothetical protein
VVRLSAKPERRVALIEDYLQRPWVVAQLRNSVLGQDLDALTDELASLGYGIKSIQNHLHGELQELCV